MLAGSSAQVTQLPAFMIGQLTRARTVYPSVYPGKVSNATFIENIHFISLNALRVDIGVHSKPDPRV